MSGGSGFDASDLNISRVCALVSDHGEAKIPSLVLRVKPLAGCGGYETCWAFLADAASPEALGGLLHELVFEPPFGEKRAYRVLLILASSGSFGKDQDAVR